MEAVARLESSETSDFVVMAASQRAHSDNIGGRIDSMLRYPSDNDKIGGRRRARQPGGAIHRPARPQSAVNRGTRTPDRARFGV